MKRIPFFPVFLIVITVLLIQASAIINGQISSYKNPSHTQTEEDETNDDKTLSPFFFVKSGDPSLDQLPLKATHADVRIAGVIADVVVKQEYANEGKKPIEAIYIFPASTRAAVYGMKMTIGERTIIAKIAGKDQARKDYEEARNQGRSASLLEQQRPNVFQMNVANIMPGDKILVELKYTELLIPEEDTYRFVYPTVVGPRYSNQKSDEAPGSEQWVKNPYLHEKVKPTYAFGIRCEIAAGMPVSDVKCRSHKTSIHFSSPAQVEVILDPTENQGGNRDYILEYRLKGEKIETGLLLYPGEKENFFLAMIQPPKLVEQKDIPPREYVFIMDVSGSMNGYPIDISKKLMRELITDLRPVDCFNVLLFAGGNSLFAERSVPADEANLQRALAFIDKEQGGGGTELLPALRRALSLHGTERYARSFVIASDGYVSVEREAFDLIRKNLNKANFFAFGIGTSVNRHLIEGLAHAGKGMPFIITEPSLAVNEAERFRQYIHNPVLSHIKVRFEGFDVYDVEPSSIPDVFGQRPVLIFGKYRGTTKGTIGINGISSGGEYESKIQVRLNNSDLSNNALRYLWARERIRILDDFGEGENNSEKITELGLTYNLLTRFTSFVAIDSDTRNQGENSTTVQQPLPLPEGVSDMAIGGVMVQGSASPKLNRLVKGIAVQEEVSTLDSGSSERDMESVFLVVEQMPEFPGGGDNLKSFLRQNLVYPVEAINAGISGKVHVTFVVGADGRVRDIQVVRGIGGGCNEEAIRLVESMPKWIPGKQGGKTVSVQYTLVIEFALGEG